MSDEDSSQRYDANGMPSPYGIFNSPEQARERAYGTEIEQQRYEETQAEDYEQARQHSGAPSRHAERSGRAGRRSCLGQVVMLGTLVALGYWGWRSFGGVGNERPAYEQLDAAGKAERDKELSQIVALRRESARKTQERMNELVEHYYADLNAGTFEATRYFEPGIETFVTLTRTTPSAVDEYVKNQLATEFRGCTLSYDKDSLQPETIVQYSFIELASCPVAAGKPTPRRTLVRLRLSAPGETEAKLDAYYRLKPPTHAPPKK